ncbi:hypothetical protein [Nocardia altamirensis]|uniref:hypothetical protein n=1 Tax=Nocardia altamirensis TaxID=472158 RepID=UPI001C3F852A|nr:hypothetical protein [Nocardia altamirensis]
MVFHERQGATAALVALIAELRRSTSRHVLAPTANHLVGPAMPDRAFEARLWGEARARVIFAHPAAAADNLMPSSRPRVQPENYPEPLSELQLATTTTAVSMAEMHARMTLSRWGLNELAEVTEQIMTELVTEALKATGIAYPHHRLHEAAPLKLLTARIRRTQHSLVIEVVDDRPIEADSEIRLGFNQRVAALSHRYGRFRNSDNTVTTWCELATASRTVSPIWGI